MVNAIDAQLGLVDFEGQNGQRDMKALSHQLRGQQQMGDFYSLSPTLSQFGQNMSQRATQQAQQVGTRRQQSLSRSRQARQDKIAAETLKYTQGRQVKSDKIKADALIQSMKGYSDIENQTVNGESGAWGINNTTGKYELVPGTEGMKATKVGGKTVWPVNIPGSDEKAFWNSDTGMVTVPRLGNQEFNGLDDPMLAESLKIVAEGKGEIERQRALEKGFGEEVITQIEGLTAQTGSLKNASVNVRTIINALDAGASSGKGWDYLPTLTDSTAQLESAVAGLTLDALTQYKLTPVSDRDLAELRKQAAPNLYGGPLRRWALHKEESINRMQQANRITEDYLREHGSIPYGKQRDALEAKIKKVLTADGFDFAFKLNAADKKDLASGEAPFTGTEDGGNIPVVDGYPPYINTPELKAAYDRMNP